jgi:Urocanase Rossmann-like domain
MPLEPLSRDAFAFIAQVERAFAGLMRLAASQNEPGQNEAGRQESGQSQSGLGGKLLYAGNLDPFGRAFTVAAVIAGAATLAASADPAAAKQAMRQGQIDFLVNSLDEALRILKNQVRKRETAAVCVIVAPASVEAEMRARGVVPDLSFREDFRGAVTGAREEGEKEKTWLTWRVTGSPALWLPKLDAIALAALPPEEMATRRWLERAPRVLGRLAQNARTLHTPPRIADEILARLGNAVGGGAIPTAVEITLGPWSSSPAQFLSSSVP